MAQEFYETLGEIKGGKFVGLKDREYFEAAMRNFPDGIVGVRFEVLGEEHHTRKQEKGFHAMISPWAKEDGHAIEDLKHDLLAEIFGKREHVDSLTGEVVMVLREPHTSKLNKKKYNELIERTLDIAARMGHVLEAPSEYLERKASERHRRSA